ncbi:MAG: PAS domain-containing protein [Candidatus Ratteibacteria bacterium]
MGFEEELKNLKELLRIKELEILNYKKFYEEHKNIVSNFPGIIVALNQYENIEFINENGAKLLGYSAKDLIGENWFDRCIPENIKENLRFIFSKIFEGSFYEYRYYENFVQTRYKTLKKIGWWNVYIRDARDIIKTIISYGTEISQKELIKNETVQEKTLLKIFDLLPEAVHVIDSDYNILYFNETFKRWNRILGLEVEIENKKIFDVFPFLATKVLEEYETVFSRGEILITKEENFFGDKKIVTETRKIPIFEKEKVIHVLTFIREITDFLNDNSEQ